MSTSIRKYRLAQGLSQKELAERVGVGSSAAVSMWENGQREPDLARIKALASVLNVSIDELLADADE